MIYIIRGGGVLKAEESYVDIKNSTFSNSFSRDRGGIFFIDNCPSLDIDSIEVRNTTSTSSVKKKIKKKEKKIFFFLLYLF